MRKTLSICAAWLGATVTLSGCQGPDDSTETTAVPSALSTGNGLKGEYFDNMDFTALNLTRTDATVNFNWGMGAPGGSVDVDTFSVRWTGQVEALYSQTYTFYTASDDGVRLWINGQRVINNWTDHGSTENSGSIALTAGQRYDIKLEYYENGGAAVVTLSWSSSSQAKQVIPQTQLYPPASPSTSACGTADENGTLTLSCPSGQTIASVAFASYGTPSGSCGSFSKGTCDASTSMSVLTSACVGKGSCSVTVSNSTFGDPCYGTVKHLYAQVSCIGDSSSSVCATAPENASATLSCPSGQVVQSISFASYGTPSGSCGAFSKGTCDASTSTSVVSSACVGRASCTVNAGNTTFGDPCQGIVKLLDIQAKCGAAVPPDAGTGDAGSSTKAGNPYGSCSKGLPANAQPADVSSPTTVVGSGAGCTFADLQAAVAKGGIITFNCGSGPFTIPVTATLKPPIDKNTVIDGGNKITLDGGRAVQIIRFESPNFQVNDNGLTLQHITLVNGKATPTQAIPPAPAPCSQGWNDGQGGAIYVRDGYLTIIDSIFMDNQAAPLGPDTGGGAVYALGSKAGVLIVSSTFDNNSGSNAGAVGCLFAPLTVYNSLISNNNALGNGANSDEPSKCSVINAGQHEVGSGGNGGGLYSDGRSVNVYLCGDAILNNHAGQGAFGGGLFFTSNDMGGTLSIIDTTMTGNTGGWWTQVASGSVTNVGTAVGTNSKSITLESSTLQGLN